MNRFRLIVSAALVTGLMGVSAASAQTVSVVSGNGQVLGASNLVVQPLVVKVTDSSGNPLANATVNWVTTSFTQGVFLSTGTTSATTITDSTGVSSVYFSLPISTFPSNNFLSAIQQTTIVANVSGGNSVNFTLTNLLTAPNTFFVPQLIPSLVNTFAGDTYSGAVGTTGTQTIQLHVDAANGQANNPVPFASVQLLNYQDPATGPSVICGNNDPQANFGAVLTDAFGNATCNVAFRGQPGRGTFVIIIGGSPSATLTPAGYWQFAPNDENFPTPVVAAGVGPLFRINATPGAPGNIRKIQGDSQTVNPGTQLPVGLQVEVDDAAGKPLSGVTVNWRVTPANGANLGTTTGTTDFNGRASTSVIVSGNAAGNVQVTATLASDTTKSVTFSISVIPAVTITAFTIVSGNNQSAPTNTSFTQPLVVQLTTSAGSAAGINVQFTPSGPISLSSTSATTDANGRAQVNVNAGSTTGSASVTASVTGTNSQTFFLTVVPPPPPITAANFVNGADLQQNSLSPCSLGAVISAPNALGVPTVGPTFPGLPVPNTNARVTIGNIGAPILNVSINAAGQNQITFQVPCEVTPGAAVPATLTVGSGSSNVNLAIGAASPGIFQTLYTDGQFRAVAVRPDGSFVSLANPARRGEQIVAYVTGLGPTTPAVGTQGLPQPGSTATVQGTVLVGMAGRAVPFISARLSQDITGTYLVTFQIPSDLPTGNDTSFSVTVQSGGTSYNSGNSRIPVQ